jgi:GNAT superfamily N-acetyltransferase
LGKVQEMFGEKVLKNFYKKMNYSDCYLIFNGNEIVGYSWSSNRLCKNEGSEPFFFDINPKNEMFYIFNVFIKPEERRKNFYTILFKFLLEEARKKGFKKGFYFFDGQNVAMRAFAEKYGFQIIGHLKYRRYFSKVIRDIKDLNKFCQVNS